MAFINPASSPLTDAQAELTSKLSSMKGLLSLPFRKQKNIPKSQQISTFDYLLRILNILGVSPDIIFRLFFEKIFSVTDDFLEDTILKSIAETANKKGVVFSPDFDNYEYLIILKGRIPATFSQTLKQKMAQEFSIMLFGPRENNSIAQAIGINDIRVRELVDSAVCSSQLFSISTTASIRDEDVEFNKIKLRRQLEKGEVVFEISCQEVKIKLPEDPGFIFGPGGNQIINNQTISPAQSMTYLAQHVASQTQNINNQNNSNSAGKSFWQIMIERLFNYITTLTFPYVGALLSVLNTEKGTSYKTEDFAPNPCTFKRGPSLEKEYSTKLINSLYKELLAALLIIIIREFKKMVRNYFARTAAEKIRRKSEKMKMKFQLFGGVKADAAKAVKFKAALKSLSSILDDVS